MADAGVIIKADLKGEDLTNKIDKLVKDVDSKFSDMAQKIDDNVQLIKLSLGELGSTAQAKVSEIKQAFTQLGTTFDQFARAMERAAAAASGAGGRGGNGGNGGGGNTYAPNTIGALEQEIAAGKALRKEAELYSDDLKDINNSIERQTRLLNQETKGQQKLTEEAKKTAQAQEKTRVRAAISMPTNDIQETERKLLRLQGTLQRLQHTRLLDESHINRVKKAITATQGELEKLKAKAARPITVDEVLGMPTKTIDQITAKMKELRRVQATLPEESSGIQQLNREYDALKKKKDELLGKNAALIKSNSALARSWNYIKNRLAFALTVGAITNFTKQLIEVRGQYELLERSLGVLTGSMQRGSEIFSELNAMAIQSPFTLIELGTAAKQLTAYNFKANEVVNVTKRMADISAALGVPMERLVYNLGQIRAQTVLTARDARDFANAGLAIVPELAKYYTQLEGKVVSTADVFDRMKKKAVSYNDTMAVLNKVTDEGGQFFDFQAKQAGTLKVQLANLSLAWNNMLNSIGKSNQSALSTPISILRSLFQSWDSIAAVLRDVAIAYGLVKAAQITFILTTRNTTLAAATAVTTSRSLVGALTSIKGGLTSLMSSPMTWWMLAVTAITSVVTTLIDANSELKEFNTQLRKMGEENVNNITKFLDDYSRIRERISSKDSKERPGEEELKKTWEALKEEIELTSGASDAFINKLMSIENINERVKASFDYLETIKMVSAAIERLGSKDILIQQDYSKWWNLGTFYDSLYENVKEYTEAQQRASASTEEFLKEHLTLGNTIEDAFYGAEAQLKTLKENIETTHQSLLDFINDKGWSANVDAVNEAYGQIGRKIIQQGMEEKGWTPDDVFNFQLEWEEKRSKAAKQALEQRIAQEQTAYYTAENEKTSIALKAQYDRDKEQLDNWERNNGRGKIIWADFCKWMNDEHSSEIQSMYNKFTKNGTQAIDYSSKEWMDWTQKMAKKYTDEHHLAQDDVFNRLYKWIATASNWDLFIKLHIVSEDTQSVYDILTDADKAANDAYGKVKRLGQEIDRLKAKREKSKDAVELAFVDKDIEKATKEQIKAQEELNEAKKKGGRSSAEEADANKRANAANKANAKARREQAKAESELQKALRDELQVIDKVQAAYKKLTKAGVSRDEALGIATSGFESTAKNINNVLKKYGIAQFDIKKFAGISNPREMLKMLEDQLAKIKASGKSKPVEIKELEAQIDKIRVDAKEYDMKRITDGLNNELGKIKEEYELAVELDANPELGDMFAQAFGIDTTGFPKTVQEAVDMMQDSVDKAIAEAQFGEGIDIDPEDLLNTFDILRDDIDKWSKATGIALDSNVIDAIQKMQKEARDLYTKDAKQTISDWQKLLEKYAEYETKRTEIQKQAEKERETARKHGASQEIFDAIDLKEQRKLAKLEFDEFQKSATWITATGDLSNLTNKALQMLIDRLWEYKRAAKNLDPKDIIKLNNAMRKLRKEQKKDNPFAAFSISMDEAKQRMEQFEPEIQDLESKIKDLWAKDIDQGGLSDEDQKRLEKYIKLYKELVDLQQEAGKVPFVDKMKSIGKIVSSFKDAASAFKQIADSTNDFQLQQAAEAVDDIIGNFEAAEKGAETWGGWWGAIIGGVTDAIPKIMKWLSGNASIDNKIRKSQLEVKRLELAYKNLQHAVEQAYGVEQYGLQRQIIAYKKLQLEQLKEQLRLEQSRKSKYRNEEAIISIKSEIIDMENEINDATQNIVNDLLGISSVGDFAENLVSSMIQAFKQGEDYMKVFEESFDDMVDNMIMKAIVSRLIGDFINQIFDRINQNVKNSENAQKAQSEIDKIAKERSDVEDAIQKTEQEYADLKKWFDKGMYGDTKQALETTLKQLYAKRDELDNQMSGAIDAYNAAIAPTPEDISDIQDMVAQGKQGIKEKFDAWMELFGVQFGQNAGDAQLSALQQGIMGITEETAGALEAYMNGVSQQVYLQSDLLTQIRDILINFGGDVTIATNAQILLQLQQSFQVQMTIQNVLTGVLNASGLAFRVEMV